MAIPEKSVWLGLRLYPDHTQSQPISISTTGLYEAAQTVTAFALDRAAEPCKYCFWPSIPRHTLRTPRHTLRALRFRRAICGSPQPFDSLEGL